MGKKCIFPSCKNKQLKKDDSFDHIQFHSFPTKRADVLEKWIQVIGRRDDWKPGKASRVCSIHFAPECFKDTSGPRKLLHPDAIPTQYQGAVTDKSCRLDEKKFSQPLTKSQVLRLQYIKKIKDIQRRNKILKLRIRRRDTRIKELKSRLSQLRSNFDYETKAKKARERLEGFSKELLEHSMRNLDTKRTGIRYSSSLREFALTLYLHSPRAYVYVRSLLRLLPNPSLIKKWISNFNRSPPDPNINSCNIITSDEIVAEAGDLNTTEQLIIDDIDSFIVIEDPSDLQSCITGVATNDVNSIPLVVAQQIQIQ